MGRCFVRQEVCEEEEWTSAQRCTRDSPVGQRNISNDFIGIRSLNSTNNDKRNDGLNRSNPATQRVLRGLQGVGLKPNPAAICALLIAGHATASARISLTSSLITRQSNAQEHPHRFGSCRHLGRQLMLGLVLPQSGLSVRWSHVVNSSFPETRAEKHVHRPAVMSTGGSLCWTASTGQTPRCCATPAAAMSPSCSTVRQLVPLERTCHLFIDGICAPIC